MKKIYCLVAIVCISVFLISLFCVIMELKKTNRYGGMQILDGPYPVCMEETVSLIEKQYILLQNKPYGIVQIFDSKGNFVWGVQIVTGKNIDANAVSYYNGKLYIYELYTQTIYEFSNFELTNAFSVDTYLSDTDFYNTYPNNHLVDYKCKFTGPTEISLYTHEGDFNKCIALKTNIKIITYERAFLLMIVSGIAFWYFKEKLMK